MKGKEAEKKTWEITSPISNWADGTMHGETQRVAYPEQRDNILKKEHPLFQGAAALNTPPNNRNNNGQEWPTGVGSQTLRSQRG